MAKMTTHNELTKIASRSVSRRGFSLVELMCVITIVSILATVTGPSIVGMLSGDQLTNNAYQLSGLAQQARSTAISEHTYVWLGFYSYTRDGTPAVMAASIITNSGLGSDLPSTSANVAANFRVAAKPVILKNATLATASNYAGLIGLASPNTDAVSPGYTSYSFPLGVPGNASAVFSGVIVFGPDGQVYLPSNAGVLGVPTQCVGMGINAAPAGPTLKTAAIQIRGLSGQVSVLRQ